MFGVTTFLDTQIVDLGVQNFDLGDARDILDTKYFCWIAVGRFLAHLKPQIDSRGRLPVVGRAYKPTKPGSKVVIRLSLLPRRSVWVFQTRKL